MTGFNDPDQGLADLAEQLQQDLLGDASLEGEERMLRDVFVDRMVHHLSEAGELEDGTACFHQARSVEISGYHVSQDEGRLDLFGVVLTQSPVPVTVPKADVDRCLHRLLGFLDRARRDGPAGLEEAMPTFDMFDAVQKAWKRVSRVRLFVFTDGLTTLKATPPFEIDGVSTSVHLWDLRRLHRLVSSGRQQEPVSVDFVQRFGHPMPCLATGGGDAGLRTFLAVVPGRVLGEVYREYGTRLLELNVRSFLQARGKVNRGIRKTILDEPDRFLAYNNGISATASAVDMVRTEDDGIGIRSLQDLQIVNGGQTTASLHHAMVRDGADLDGIHVQMKLTVVEPERLDEVVPLISRYANSQNKVNEADFSSNHPFHVRVEQLSRTVWAPAVEGTQQQTRWFYERARGQYQDAVFRSGTPARQRQFKHAHPKDQCFDKTGLAKFELAWAQLPHLVSLGAQKCFQEFTLRLGEPEQTPVEQAYFHDLIARALLFRRAEKLVSSLRLGGYRANVVAYSVALLSERSNQRIDLERVWRQQALDPELEDAVLDLAPRIWDVLVDTPNGGNVTEWAKKPACWQRVQALPWQLPAPVVWRFAHRSQPSLILMKP